MQDNMGCVDETFNSDKQGKIIELSRTQQPILAQPNSALNLKKKNTSIINKL